jgi:hypothetical protein
MSVVLDPIVAKHRYDAMLQEAEQIRLVKQIAKANGQESLLGRMVKLLSRSSKPEQLVASTEGTLSQPQLADAKGS